MAEAASPAKLALLTTMKTWIVDTGPLVAYLDATDPAHTAVAVTLDEFRGQLATTGAVLTEAMHFVSSARHGPRLLSELVSSNAMTVYDLCRQPELTAAVALMEKYSDTPMDFADATLVLLAEALEIRDVLTLDRRGFATYRTRSRRSFRIVLDGT